MTLDEIAAEWAKDSKIDKTELGVESIRIPELHSKYLKIFFDERRRLKGYQFQSRETYLKKYEYYNGKMSEEEMKDLGWEPFMKRLMKGEVDYYLDADRDMIQEKAKIVNQEEKIDMVAEIIKNLNQRNFQIKNAIDYLKFTNGVQ